MEFCDRSDLIFISYHGGSGGFALKKLLSLSTEVNAPAVDDHVREDGAAHMMVRRYDLFDDGLALPSVMSWPNIGAHRKMLTLKKSHQLDRSVIESIRQRINASRDIYGASAAAMPGKVAMVDHLRPCVARLIFPNAILLRITRDEYASIKAFYTKNLLQPTAADPTITMDASTYPLSIDAHVISRRLQPIKTNYRRVARHHSLRPMARQRAAIVDDSAVDVFDVRFEDLFSERWSETYEGLVKHCGVTGDHMLAAGFVDQYVSNQPKRGIYDDRLRFDIDGLRVF